MTAKQGLRSDGNNAEDASEAIQPLTQLSAITCKLVILKSNQVILQTATVHRKGKVATWPVAYQHVQ
jgi:hypothetical protein